MEVHLLHGTLELKIHRIDRLHHHFGFNLCGKGNESLGKRVQSQLKRMPLSCMECLGGKLYATVDLDKTRVARTRTRRQPKWFEPFNIYCAHSISRIVFTIKEGQPISATLIGRAYLPVGEVINGSLVDRWLDILDESKNPIQGGSRIHVQVKFNPVARDPDWNKGIRLPEFKGVPYAFFNQREECHVTFYQDAHVLSDFPEITLAEGQVIYKHHHCWEEMFDAIWNAKHLIYITGWSVYTDIRLIRDPSRMKPGGNLTLGELLKKKANEGVTVLMLVWDDRTSIEVFKRAGLMSTHDQETYEYFKNTQVRCVLCPRNPDSGKTILQGFEAATTFTHHQKTVIVDSEVQGSYKRRIVSFLGGIDLCDGRYDTEEHLLFSTLNTVHAKDFHQPNFDGASIKKGGPREPWHDIHCKLEGPVAWDVLYNFEQRWMKQGRRRYLIPMERLEEIMVPPSTIVSPENQDRWTVQIFRSIDGGAVEGFPEDTQEASSLGLMIGKDSVIDRSIQDAYINAIRRARHFIYIENQYFIGSSFGWKSNPEDIPVEEINALHLIPKELSLKIVSKIEAGQRFTVYVVIPLWPEGKPGSASVQAMLDWQRRTMEMMYTDIANAIQKTGIEADVKDYLSFFCLGNREVKKPGEYEPPEKPAANSDYARAQESRRFMIYVHSKMMIVDDEYIIIGSANINQRSMDGGRDSEIAMGAFQPRHLLSSNQMRPTGQIFSFRISLWLEHLRFTTNAFRWPESEECIRLINSKAEELWALYAAEEYPHDYDLPGHLLSYPISVGRNGEVKNLVGTEFFPDTQARVLGTKSNYLPPILTT